MDGRGGGEAGATEDRAGAAEAGATLTPDDGGGTILTVGVTVALLKGGRCNWGTFIACGNIAGCRSCAFAIPCLPR